jgi:hypothetical protein
MPCRTLLAEAAERLRTAEAWLRLLALLLLLPRTTTATMSKMVCHSV